MDVKYYKAYKKYYITKKKILNEKDFIIQKYILFKMCMNCKYF